MLVVCALLLLRSIVDANHLRSNEILPLNVVFEGGAHIGYTFIQDSNKEDSIVLQVSYRVFSLANEWFYFCETRMVNMHREDNYIMIDSMKYEVSRHRKEHFRTLTANDGTVLRLTETNQTRSCMPYMVPTHEFHIPYYTVVTPAPNNQFMSWSYSAGADPVEYFSDSTGASVSTGTLDLSPAAAAACPGCAFLTGWDGEHHWFTQFGLDHKVRFVNSQTGAYLSWPLIKEHLFLTKVSKTYLLVQVLEDVAEYNNFVYLHRKTDGTLFRKHRVPLLRNEESCLGAFLSPDESRVLFLCPLTFFRPLTRDICSSLLLLEMCADTGEVLTMRAIPGVRGGAYYGGDRYSADSIIMKASSKQVNIYKYTV